MQTKRILEEQDARSFFDAAINTIEDAIGEATLDVEQGTISFNFNAVLLLSFSNIYANIAYPTNYPLIDADLLQLLLESSKKTGNDVSCSYVRHHEHFEHNFLFKQQQIDSTTFRYTLVCLERLLDTEKQLDLFSHVVGSGLSLFSGSTWWIDYDQYSDHFYSSDVGPTILGIPLSDNQLYNTREFQSVREKARIVSEYYDESITFETAAYEQVRHNKTDFFAGRTPAITAKDEIVWVEAYGKCILRYPDGSPRFFIAIDIYMSEIHEEKTQLELLNNLIDYGLLNSDVGVWYHQRHYREGKYYFTQSFQKLMSDTEHYNNDTFTDIFNRQIERMKQDGRGYEQHLHHFRKTHNSIYDGTLNKYDLVFPNYKNDHTLNWIEVRGTVIERDQDGHVALFVGVNVDVTESYNRNQELERLRIQNERLQLAENLAIRARDLLVWYQEVTETRRDLLIFGNDMFSTKLGIKRNEEGMIPYGAIRQSLVTDDAEGRAYAVKLIRSFKSIYSGSSQSFERLLAKHRHKQTGEILYIEHSVEISEPEFGRGKMIGGVLLDVTEDILRQNQIQYLAEFDTLTNVYNRNYFETYISTKLPPSYAIVLFDLDGLKLINDVYGHMVGDDIICRLASLLKQIFVDALFVARIGGDEFAVLSSNTNTKEVTDQINELDRLIDQFNQTTDIEMTVSKGAKLVLDNDLTFEKAFVQAENIMYRRKLNNRSSRKSKVLESILETLNAKTEETKEHSDRMAEFAVATMRYLKMSRASEIEDMQLLARVHDIGKITIDDAILKKPGKLTDSEFELIKKHSEAGYKIIRNITDSDDVCNGVLLHHERFDGSGYPQGLKGTAIPMFARIISVVDAFDAMTNDRIYHKKMTDQDAIQELKRCSGTQFDPKVVNAFIQSCFTLIQ